MRGRLLLASFLLSAAVPATANFIPEMTFEQKKSEADIVIFGKAGAAHGKPGENRSYATVKVIKALKGRPPAKIEVWTFSSWSEMDPNCCEVGATYLMFLHKTESGRFRSIQGQYGMVRVGAPQSKANDVFNRR